MSASQSPSSPPRKQFGQAARAEQMSDHRGFVRPGQTDEHRLGEIADKVMLDFHPLPSEDNDEMSGVTTFTPNFDSMMGVECPMTDDSLSDPSTSSTKTTSEVAESSSTFASPSLPAFSDTPPSGSRGSLRRGSSHTMQSPETIAQMLEYMRACNSSQSSSAPSFASSTMAAIPLSVDEKEEEEQKQQSQRSEVRRQGGRQRERSANRSSAHRQKQRSPVQKIKRSLSQGGEKNLLDNRNAAPTIIQRMRNRSKTTVEHPSSSVVNIVKEAASTADTQSPAIESRSRSMSSGASFIHTPQQSFSTSSLHQPWSTLGDSGASPAWSTQRGAPSSAALGVSQETNEERLSLMEYLQRQEGSTWMRQMPQLQHVARPLMSPVSTPTQSWPSKTSHHAAPSTDTASKFNFASIFGDQNATNQALVQAFQTAFVLGMQQLCLTGQGGDRAKSAVATTAASGQVLPDRRMQNNEHLPLQSTRMTSIPDSKGRLATHEAEESVAIVTESSQATLEELLRNINQHRPDQQEFCVDDFLAFVGNTVENTGIEEQGLGRAAAADKSERVPPLPYLSRSPPDQRDRMDTEEGTPSLARGDSTLTDMQVADAAEATPIEQEGKSRNQSEGVESESREEHSNNSTVRHVEGPSTSKPRRNTLPSSSARTKADPDREANKQAERRRRRRESHNAVERRRRDHINERIAELASLLPESMLLDAIAASTAGGTAPHIDLSRYARRTGEGGLGLQGLSDLDQEARALAPVHSSSETLALAQSKPNKGIILSKSVEYIKHLHEFSSLLRKRTRELELELQRTRDSIMIAAVNPRWDIVRQQREDDISRDAPHDEKSIAGVGSSPALLPWRRS